MLHTIICNNADNLKILYTDPIINHKTGISKCNAMIYLFDCRHDIFNSEKILV